MRIRFDATETFEQLKDRWALEVGRFVMAFGGIEGTTYHALRNFPRDPIAGALIEANLMLKPRMELLVAVCRGRGDGPWLEFAEALEKIKKLASKRNLIAHNGMGFDVYVDSAGEYYVEQAISNAKKHGKFAQKKTSDSVLFEELVAHRKEAEALNLELSSALVNVLNELSREEAEGNEEENS